MNRSRLLVLGLTLSGVILCAGVLLVGAGLYLSLARSAPRQSVAVPVTASSGAPQPTEPGAPSMGALAPDFTLRGLDQKPVHLSDLRGKAIMVNFWATWCGPCSTEMPNIQKASETLSKDDTVILAVNQGEYAEQVSGYADLYKLHFPILLDDKLQVARAYHVKALPTTFFVDRDGIIRSINIGGPMTVEFIQNEFKKLLGQIP